MLQLKVYIYKIDNKILNSNLIVDTQDDSDWEEIEAQ